MARLSIIAALASIASIAAADFQIYGMVDFGPVGGDQEVRIFDGPPDCNDVCNSAAWNQVGDLSSGRGVRCEGSGCSGTPWEGSIEELELNNMRGVHWTIYEGENYQITPADGGPLLGSCTRNTDDEFDCGCPLPARGARWFTCTSDLTAEEINET